MIDSNINTPKRAWVDPVISVISNVADVAGAPFVGFDEDWTGLPS